MPSDPAIAITGLGKRFRSYRAPGDRLLSWLGLSRLARYQDKWALADISFTIKQGEAVALIGENGAGKSTLLGALLGTVRPERGSHSVSGSIAALLELGLGLQPDFSGRRNARLALQLRGLTLNERDMTEAVDAIAAFAELGAAFDLPLRTYSTGMQMRLAFAAATVIRPDILIVDEALAVGDAYFQYKCIERIKRFRAQGTTLLFVSHDLVALRSLCDRGLLLSEGRLLLDAPIDAALNRYNALLAERHGPSVVQQDAARSHALTRSGGGEIRIAAYSLGDSGMFTSGDRAALSLRIEAQQPIEDWTLGILIRDRLGTEIFGTNTLQQNLSLPAMQAGGTATIHVDIDLQLGPGVYFLTLALHRGDSHLAGSYDWIDNALSIHVLPAGNARSIGVAVLPTTFRIEADEAG